MSAVWAFLVSVAEYNDKSLNLSFVHGDNACIKRGLVEGLLIPEEQIITCGNNCQINYSEFQATVSSFTDRITPTDRVIIFFSGHGGGAPYSLRFSDVDIEFSEFCNELERLPACAKILIIDSCYSGNSEIPESLEENPSSNLIDYIGSGYAVFASSNSGRRSTCHPDKSVSLYTFCFSNALCHAKPHEGKISLIDVAKQAALEADYISKTHGITVQHPIYKCYIPGDVLFQITGKMDISYRISIHAVTVCTFTFCPELKDASTERSV